MSQHQWEDGDIVIQWFKGEMSSYRVVRVNGVSLDTAETILPGTDDRAYAEQIACAQANGHKVLILDVQTQLHDPVRCP